MFHTKSNDSLNLMLLTKTCHKFGENCHLFVRNFFYVEEKAGDYFDQHPFHSGSRNNLKWNERRTLCLITKFDCSISLELILSFLNISGIITWSTTDSFFLQGKKHDKEKQTEAWTEWGNFVFFLFFNKAQLMYAFAST